MTLIYGPADSHAGTGSSGFGGSWPQREPAELAGRASRAITPKAHSGNPAQPTAGYRPEPKAECPSPQCTHKDPRSTVHSALRHQLRLFPYKLQLVQRLHRGDKARRVQFCRWLLSKWRLRSFRKGLFLSDEAHFHLDGSVVKQNCRVWGTEPPHEVEFREAHSPHVTVWCGVASWGVVGPYFFEDRGRVTTVTGARYRRMVEAYLLPELERRHVPTSSVWFQQDGAKPHTAASTLAQLQRAFPGKVLSKGGSVTWPPRSPDLSLPDFFLWGLLKAQVYRTRVRSLALLKRIRAVVRHIPLRTLRDAAAVLPLRARACIRLRGGYPQTLLHR